jgi:NTE family protein
MSQGLGAIPVDDTMDGNRITGVFEGGGVRGVALAGAAAAALDHGLEFERAVGTSAGALVGSLVAAGYTADELSKTVCSVDWSSLLDPVFGANIPVIGKHLALALRRGLYKGDELERVWEELLLRKGVRVFGDFPDEALSVIVTDLNHARGVTMPEDLPRFGIDPDSFPVARAIRMSASVPFLFTPVPLVDRISGETVLMADGAMTANFPISAAGGNAPIYGFRLITTHTEHPHEHIAGPASLARAVVVAGIRARYDLPRLRMSGANIVEVPVSADLDFDMGGSQARAAFDRAREVAATQIWASHGDAPDINPGRRPTGASVQTA